ncbi:MAG: exopolysaccharide biosynthesis protein [Pseudonocardiaceae bacterium]
MLSDDVLRLSVIGQIVRRRWRLLAVLAAVGALLGLGASLLFSPGYESASSVLLQGPRDEEELQTEAQIATSSVVLDRTAGALGWDVTGAGLADSVSAEVLGGNVIEIRGSATSPDRAQQLTDRVTTDYITFSTELVSGAPAASDHVLQERRETLQQRIAETNRRIAELPESAGPGAPAAEGAEARAEFERLRTTLADATAELDTIDGRQQKAEADAAFSRASIAVIEPAARPSSPAAPTLMQFIAGGALLFFLLGVFAHLVAARTDRRLRNASEIAAALGSPVVGSVDVPDLPDGPPAYERSVGSRRWLTRMWRLVCDDRPWDAPQLPISSNDLDVRYHRVLARLRGTPGRVLARLRGVPDTALRLLVLVADDDPTAHRAVAQLAVAAGVDGPAAVVTDRADFWRLVQAAAGNASTRNVRLTVQTSSDPTPGTHRTVLRVVDVSAARPTVPDCGRVSGTLVVLTAGTRTAWELIGIAEACADAGHQVVGAFVTHRTLPIKEGPIKEGPIDDRPVAPTQVNSPEGPFNGPKLAGSA